jgi:hypothetical protein
MGLVACQEEDWMEALSFQKFVVDEKLGFTELFAD